MIKEIIELERDDLLPEVQKLKDDGYRFVTSSCVDLGSSFMIYYHFDKNDVMKHLKLTSEKTLELPSISGIYLGGALSENEMKDLFGINFTGLVLDYGGKFMITGDVKPAPFAKESNPKGEE